MPIPSLIQEKKPQILQLCAKYGATKIQLFGSYAKGEETPNSDIDFLVEFSHHDLFKRIALKQELEDLLGKKIDLAKPTNLHPIIKSQIMKEALPL